MKSGAVIIVAGVIMILCGLVLFYAVQSSPQIESFVPFVISGDPIEKTHVVVLIPDWIRSNAHWWIEKQINDNDFATGLEFMIKEKIILIPNLVPSDSSEIVPDWVKNTIRW